MENNQCAQRPHGENVNDFHCRKVISRRRRIDDLVLLAIQGDAEKFKKISAGMKWTKREIARFYRKRDAVVDEFDENVLELEICNLGDETPSEVSYNDEYESMSGEYVYSSDESEPSSDCDTLDSFSLKGTYKPVTHPDPDIQKLLDELNEQAMGQMLGTELSLSDVPQFVECKFMNGKTKQLDRKNKGITNSASEHQIQNKQSLREIKTSKGVSQTRQPETSLTPELHIDADNKDSKMASATKTEPASGKSKHSFLEKFTQCFRQQQATPSKVPANADMLEIENVSAVGTAISFDDITDGSLVEVVEINTTKPKKAGKMGGFFRRIAAMFSRKRSFPSKITIHVQPPTPGTVYMSQ